MASTYSDRLRIELIGSGDQSGTWGTTTNTNLGTLIEESIAGVAAVSMTDANYTLTANNGSTDEARQMIVQLSGSLTADRNVICPTKEKLYVVKNGTSGSKDIVFKTSTGTGVTVQNGYKMLLYCDGTNVVEGLSAIGSTLIGSNGSVTMKETQTGDDTPMTLLLQTGETDIAAADVLGKSQFQAPDEGTGTDAILVAAEVAAVSEGDFSSSSNATKLSFKTGASEAATEKMSISSVGNVTVKQTATGDDTPITLLLQTGETDIAADDVLGKIQFQAPDEGTGTDALLVAAEVAAISEGDFSSSSNATSLVFKTGASEAATEKARIKSDGTLLVNSSGEGGRVHILSTTTANDDGKWAVKVINTSTNTDSTGPYGLWVNYPNASPDNNSTNDFFFASDSTAGRFIVAPSGDIWTSDGGWIDSDRNLKENIVDASGKLADVLKLKVRNFNWKASHHPSYCDRKLIGFIAQEVEEVFPGLVDEHNINPDRNSEEPNMTKGIKTTALVPILTKALQELSEQVTELKTENAAMVKRIDALESKGN